MKALVKIILLCVLLFGLSIYITVITIDQTFKRTECTQYTEISLTTKAPQSIEV